MTSSTASLQAVSPGIERNERFLSLDVFRGMIVALMIIVNMPGKGATLYPYLVHAKWLGFTVADLVFPSFLFAVGNAMSFSMDRLQWEAENVFFRKIVKRTVLVFLLGFFLYWFPFVMQGANHEWIWKPISHTRIMGVLQRIALCYFFAALMVRYFSPTAMFVTATAVLFGYWGVLFMFGDDGGELTMAGNAVRKLDLFLLGENHVYKRDLIPFDPEGILSTFPSLVNVLAGYWTGKFLRDNGKTLECLSGLMVAGLVLITIGLWWSLVFPISKKLWTSSFVLYTVGIDVLILCVLAYVVELRQWNIGVRFFDIFGKNPLFIYLSSEVLYIMLAIVPASPASSAFEWISIRVFQQFLPGPAGSLLTAIAFMLICWLLGWLLDRRRIYIRL